jgi:O-antigen/teichoic acid export membrane protein
MSAGVPAGEPDVLAADDVAGRVVRGGAARTAGFAVVNLLGLVGAIVLLRHLGVSDYGRYGTVIALVAIVSGVADAGLTVTGSRELSLLPRGPERRRVLGAILGVRLLLSSAAMAVALAFAAVAGYEDVMILGTLLAGVGSILIGAQATLTLPLGVELRNVRLALSEIVKQAILVVGIVALVAAGATLGPFFAVQVAVGVGGLLAVPLLVERSQLAWPRFSRADWSRLAVTALPVALASVLIVLYVRLLVVISSLLTSEFQTGLFVTSARITEMVAGLAMLLSGVILPVATVAARDDRPRLRYVLIRTTKVSLLIGGMLALILAVAAEPIVVVLGGESFEPAATILRIQAPVVLTIFLVYPWISFLIADGRRRELVRSMLFGLVLVTVSGVVLISALDASGAALAAVVADVALAATVIRAIRAVGDGAWPLPGWFLWRYVLVLGVSGGAGALALSALPAAAAGAVAATAFAAGALALRIVPEELGELIPRRR